MVNQLQTEKNYDNYDASCDTRNSFWIAQIETSCSNRDFMRISGCSPAPLPSQLEDPFENKQQFCSIRMRGMAASHV
jgi:hypothetical protein